MSVMPPSSPFGVPRLQASELAYVLAGKSQSSRESSGSLGHDRGVTSDNQERPIQLRIRAV